MAEAEVVYEFVCMCLDPFVKRASAFCNCSKMKSQIVFKAENTSFVEWIEQSRPVQYLVSDIFLFFCGTRIDGSWTTYLNA